MDIPAWRLIQWREHPGQMVEELFGVTPDAWQAKALEAFPYAKRICLKACKGPGKGNRKSMLFWTPEGVRKWGDLQVGDSVFAEDGSPTKVMAIHELGPRAIFRVTFDDGSFSDCTEDHLWKVQGRTERRKGLGWSVIDTKEIIRRGVTVPNGKWKQKQFIIPRQGAAQFPTASLPVDPYLTGVWLGDGSKGSPSYGKPYVEVESEINRRGYKTSRAKDGIMVRVLNSVNEFKELECCDAGSHERFIPSRYKASSAEQRSDLLCGLMDTDGCVGDDSHMEFATTSERLAQDVVWLVRSLGGIAFIKDSIKEGWYRDADGVRVDCRDCYRITVRTPFNPFRVEHKASRWRDPLANPSTERYLTRFIASIEPAGSEDAMCIEVEHPSHCYLANDFIVTHNTATLSWLGWNFLLTRPNAMVGATSISSPNLKANLWSEMARWRNIPAASVLRQQFEYTRTEIYHREYRATWRMEARSWAQDADASQIGNALAGLHADYVMWLLDESGDYPDALMPTAEGIFSGSPKEAHIVQAGNPTRLSGPLYRACTTARNIWVVIEITADPDDPDRTPRVSPEIAREQIQQYGRDNPWVLVNIFGQFPPSSIDSLIGPDEVMAAMKRYYRAHEIGNAPKVLGVDVALFGDDASVIAPRQGIQCFPFKKMRNVEPEFGAGVVARMEDEFGSASTFIDNSGGYGASWISWLRAMKRTPIGIQFAGQAHDPARFYNKRAEMAWDAVQWIKMGGALVENPELLAALTQTTYTYQKGKLLLEPKEKVKAKIGYSPDDFDAFILTFAEPVAIAPVIPRRQKAVEQEYNPYAEPVDSSSRSGYANRDFDPYR